jgi:sugar phosphate isomerase/epimerase
MDGGGGYEGVQIPTWDARCIDLKTAAESQDYCDDLAGRCAEAGVAITELDPFAGAAGRGPPAYDAAFDGFAPEAVRANPPSDRHGRSSNLDMPPGRVGGWA